MFGSYNYAGHRALIHDVLLRYAVSLGIDIRMGQEVVDYWEDDENKTAGVILRSGETLRADLVVAAEGIKSRARKYVLVSPYFFYRLNSKTNCTMTHLGRGTMIGPVHPDMQFIEHGLKPRNKAWISIRTQIFFAKTEMSSTDGPVMRARIVDLNQRDSTYPR